MLSKRTRVCGKCGTPLKHGFPYKSWILCSKCNPRIVDEEDKLPTVEERYDEWEKWRRELEGS